MQNISREIFSSPPWLYIGFWDRPRADIFAPKICTSTWRSSGSFESGEVAWFNVFKKDRGASKTLETFSSAPLTKRWLPFPLMMVIQFISCPWTWGRAISCHASSFSSRVFSSQGAKILDVCQRLQVYKINSELSLRKRYARFCLVWFAIKKCFIDCNTWVFSKIS